MKPVNATRSIHAPLTTVFQTVADVRNLAKAVPHIQRIEFLTEQESGVGARFRETRIVNGRETETTLQVTEFVQNDRIRLISDAGGTIWDTVFSVTPDHGPVQLRLDMDIRPYRLLAKLLIPLVRRSVVKGVARDLDCIKAYCDRTGAG